MRDPPKLVKAERGENLKKGGLASRLFLTYEPSSFGYRDATVPTARLNIRLSRGLKQ